MTSGERRKRSYVLHRAFQNLIEEDIYTIITSINYLSSSNVV
nr:MAG TPA: hypothetical protein [Bacteriophage sp.]